MSKGNRSADPRKRALRLLAREHFSDYSSICEDIRPTAQNRYQARDRAEVQLRSRLPARFLELYAQEQAGPGTDIPAEIRSKSWPRALARQEELRAHGVSGALGNISGQVVLRVYGRGAAGLDEPDGTVAAALLCGRWWYCWPEAMPISPVAPVAWAGQAIISESGLGDDGEHRATDITSLALGRMLRSAHLSIADPPSRSPAR